MDSEHLSTPEDEPSYKVHEELRTEQRLEPDQAEAEREPASVAPVWLVAGLMILVLGIVFVLYITNSRITDLEMRVASLSNSADAKAAKAVPPSRGSGPQPDKVYSLNIEGAPDKGESSAPITIVEMSDFECPFCAKVQPTLAKVREVYKDNVRMVWKHLPLEDLHPSALSAATASEAANKQGKFWEYHDKLFANQRKFSSEQLRQYASEIGLNMSKFDADMADPATKKRITDDAAEANSLGVTGTPGFFINGRFLNGAQPFEAFSAAINAELKRLNLPVPEQ